VAALPPSRFELEVPRSVWEEDEMWCRHGSRALRRRILAICCMPMVWAAEGGAALAHGVLAVAPADLRPSWGTPEVAPAEPALRLGFAVDGLSNGGPYLSPALSVISSPAGWQGVLGHVRWVPRLAVELRGPVRADGLIAAEMAQTLGEALAVEASSYVLRRWAGIGLFARGHLRAALVEAARGGVAPPERVDVVLGSAGIMAGLELSSVLLVASSSQREVWSDTPAGFVDALEGGDVAFGVIVRLTPLFWFMAQGRPFGQSVDSPGRWALGIAGCFWPLDD
jgi:hypothetical protein